MSGSRWTRQVTDSGPNSPWSSYSSGWAIQHLPRRPRSRTAPRGRLRESATGAGRKGTGSAGPEAVLAPVPGDLGEVVVVHDLRAVVQVHVPDAGGDRLVGRAGLDPPVQRPAH